MVIFRDRVFIPQFAIVCHDFFTWLWCKWFALYICIL